MFQNNCVLEVQNFLDIKIDKSLSSNKIIGVKEIKEEVKEEEPAV